MRYGHLIDEARRLLSDHRPGRLNVMVQHRRLLSWEPVSRRLYPPFFHRRWGRYTGSTSWGGPCHAEHPHRAPATILPIPRLHAAGWACSSGASAAQQGGALQAASRLLRRAGFEVSIPAAAGCCGALSQHSGDCPTAARLADINRMAFSAGLDTVVSTASGCGITSTATNRHCRVHIKISSKFLLDHGGFTCDDFAPCRAGCCFTPPAVSRTSIGEQAGRGIFDLIPQIEIVPLGEAGQCCGSRRRLYAASTGHGGATAPAAA